MNEISKLISEERTVTLTAKGYSMNPFIVHMQDQLTLGPWKDEDIRKGAVVLVKDDRGNFLVHRIIDRRGDKILLMGDGNIGIQETASVTNIIGIMTAVTKKKRSYPTNGLIWRIYSWIWLALTVSRFRKVCLARTYRGPNLRR